MLFWIQQCFCLQYSVEIVRYVCYHAPIAALHSYIHLWPLRFVFPYFYIIAIVENYCSADFVLLGLLFSGQKYDEAKEAQALLEKKQKQLNRVESLKLAEDAAGQ